MEQLPAAITVTTELDDDLDLRWLRALVIPAEVQVSVVDLGWRCDITLTRRGENVAIIGDLLTGDRVIQTDGTPTSPLVRYGLFVFQQRQASARQVRLSPQRAGASSIDQIASANPDALLLRAGEVIDGLGDENE